MLFYVEVYCVLLCKQKVVYSWQQHLLYLLTLFWMAGSMPHCMRSDTWQLSCCNAVTWRAVLPCWKHHTNYIILPCWKHHTNYIILSCWKHHTNYIILPCWKHHTNSIILPCWKHHTNYIISFFLPYTYIRGTELAIPGLVVKCFTTEPSPLTNPCPSTTTSYYTCGHGI